MSSKLGAIIRGQGMCGMFKYMLILHLNVPTYILALYDFRLLIPTPSEFPHKLYLYLIHIKIAFNNDSETWVDPLVLICLFTFVFRWWRCQTFSSARDYPSTWRLLYVGPNWARIRSFENFRLDGGRKISARYLAQQSFNVSEHKLCYESQAYHHKNSSS